MDQIFTVGHSTRTVDDFISILQSFHIELLADIRRFPGSKRYPHFNKDLLEASLEKVNIRYIHFVELGGRRKPQADSTKTAWRSPAFKGYADYMETAEFRKAITELEKLAHEKRTCYMCSEAVWWRCHRALVSDFLKVKGWKVMHIMDVSKAIEHPYT